MRTKIDMVSEIIANVRWSNSQKVTAIKCGIEKPKAYIEKLYNAWIEDGREHTLFYASLLNR